MKIVVIGGTGLIGSNVVDRLRMSGHDVTAASPSSGVNTVTGVGVAEVLQGVDVVVDVANSPSFEDKAVMEFFQTAGRNLLTAETAAGVGHHVALSIVGADRMPDIGYMRAKVAQEDLIKGSGVPYTIVRATQFFEFAASIAQTVADGDTVRPSSALMQPVAADDVAATLAEVAVAEPANETVDLAGPDQLRQDDLVRRALAAKQDTRQVVTDPAKHYFGAAVDDQSLVPIGRARLGGIHFADWLTADRAKAG